MRSRALGGAYLHIVSPYINKYHPQCELLIIEHMYRYLHNRNFGTFRKIVISHVQSLAIVSFASVGKDLSLFFAYLFDCE